MNQRLQEISKNCDCDSIKRTNKNPNSLNNKTVLHIHHSFGAYFRYFSFELSFFFFLPKLSTDRRQRRKQGKHQPRNQQQASKLQRRWMDPGLEPGPHQQPWLRSWRQLQQSQQKTSSSYP